MKIRLQRFLADCGVASRRVCEGMVAEGRVRVNGEVRSQLPVFIETEKDVVTVDGEKLGGKGGGGAETGKALQEQRKVYYLLNKPKGILVTNYDPADRKTVGELMIGVAERVFPVGRLDMDSRGALIMTNDGELANRLTHPRYGVEKTYVVEVDGRVGPAELERMKRGMWLGPERPGAEGVRGGTRTERFHTKVLGRERGRTVMEVRFSESKNREIRRVLARLGHPVRDLNRVAIGGKVTIQRVDVGKYRPLTDEEVKWLFHASSPEHHDRERAATQAWYEAKEMEKERKRLTKGGEAGPLGRPRGVPRGGGTAGSRGGAAAGARAPFPARPRLGKPAGGPARGPSRGPVRGPARGPATAGRIGPIQKDVRAAHPLGNLAQRDEE